MRQVLVQDGGLLLRCQLVAETRLGTELERKISSLTTTKQNTSNKTETLGLAVSISGTVKSIKEELS